MFTPPLRYTRPSTDVERERIVALVEGARTQGPLASDARWCIEEWRWVARCRCAECAPTLTRQLWALEGGLYQCSVCGGGAVSSDLFTLGVNTDRAVFYNSREPLWRWAYRNVQFDPNWRGEVLPWACRACVATRGGFQRLDGRSDYLLPYIQERFVVRGTVGAQLDALRAQGIKTGPDYFPEAFWVRSPLEP